jgi:hypothetical protein
MGLVDPARLTCRGGPAGGRSAQPAGSCDSMPLGRRPGSLPDAERPETERSTSMSKTTAGLTDDRLGSWPLLGMALRTAARAAG